jgi:NADH-quinone oxidoreductase subunit L
MLFIAFFGPDRTEQHGTTHAHGGAVPGWVMQLPVALLAVGAVASGYLSIGDDNSPWYRFLAPDFPGADNVPLYAPAISDTLSTIVVLAIVALGIGLAYWRYGSPAATENSVARLVREGETQPQVLVRGYYVDDLIGALIVRPALALGDFFGRTVDAHVIDGAVRDLAWGAGLLGFVARKLQSGLVRAYAIALVVGVAGFLAYYAFGVSVK